MVHEKQEGEPGTEVEAEQAIELWIPVFLFAPRQLCTAAADI